MGAAVTATVHPLPVRPGAAAPAVLVPGAALCPALLVSAPASGQGKTTVVAGLARLWARRGLRVQVFKCGPDFLDPLWHRLASGQPVHALDLWINGADDCARRLHAAAQQADVLLVEGVMGLFDGQPSAADLAQRFGLPVLAVVDAAAMAETFGAVAHGLQHYRPGLPWAGVLANRVAGERHADMVRSAVSAEAPWWGALERVPSPSPTADRGAAGVRGPAGLWPERHLGLVAAHELPDALERLDALADALERTPLGQIDRAGLQRFTVPFAPPPAAPVLPPLLQGRTVAVARDAAFCFVYEANLATLQALGATVRCFAPLAGDALPPCDAVWLPGGYPELHAAALHARTDLRDALAAHLAAGRPVWAECGGMVALCESVTDVQGQTTPLWGLLPGHATLQPRLAGLGPQALAMGAGVLRGHTFHYSTLATPLPPSGHAQRAHAAPGAAAGEAIYRHGSLRASYFHAWFASDPVAAAALFLSEAA